jgi:hypothetical protein
VEFTVSGLSATVWDGLLVALHGGSCTLTGTFSVQGRQLVKRAVETRPTAIVRLPGNGLPLLTAARPGSGDDVAAPSADPGSQARHRDA